MRIVFAQLNPTVGNIDGNIRQLIEAADWACHKGADLLVLPELFIAGYQPEDLLLRSEFVSRCYEAVLNFAKNSSYKNLAILVGSPEPYFELSQFNKLASPEQKAMPYNRLIDNHPNSHPNEPICYNSVLLVCNGKIIESYQKRILPNHDVFDEFRVFIPGNEVGKNSNCFHCEAGAFQMAICEDAWHPSAFSRDGNPNETQFGIVINGSPFSIGKRGERQKQMMQRFAECGFSLFYLNMVGGQDELVFDGSSFAVAGDGKIVEIGDEFLAENVLVELDESGNIIILDKQIIPDANFLPKNKLITLSKHIEDNDFGEASDKSSENKRSYKACVLGLRDYVRKTGNTSVVLGLSGGIDSALVAVIAVDALGENNVHFVMLPSPYNSEKSYTDALELIDNLGSNYSTIAINELMRTVEEALVGGGINLSAETSHNSVEASITSQNIQARLRGLLLMARSNFAGELLLSTGNKSELAVGYSTLYGDMNGAFNPIKDLYKTEVYELAKLRNCWKPGISFFDTENQKNVGGKQSLIPENIIVKSPSAELKPDQTDQDTLPPYDVLDEILFQLIENEASLEDIVKCGFDRNTVEWIMKKLQFSEYKRKQSPLGPKLKSRNFGKGRRYPTVNNY